MNIGDNNVKLARSTITELSNECMVEKIKAITDAQGCGEKGVTHQFNDLELGDVSDRDTKSEPNNEDSAQDTLYARHWSSEYSIVTVQFQVHNQSAISGRYIWPCSGR